MSAWVKVIQASQAMILIPKTPSGPRLIPRSLSKSEGWSKNQKVVGPTTFTGGPIQYQPSSFVHGLMNIQKPKRWNTGNRCAPGMEGTAMAFDHGEAFWLVKTAIRPLEQQVVLLTSQGPPNPFQSHPYSTSVTHISYILALECSLKHVQTNCDVIETADPVLEKSISYCLPGNQHKVQTHCCSVMQHCMSRTGRKREKLYS